MENGSAGSFHRLDLKATQMQTSSRHKQRTLSDIALDPLKEPGIHNPEYGDQPNSRRLATTLWFSSCHGRDLCRNSSLSRDLLQGRQLDLPRQNKGPGKTGKTTQSPASQENYLDLSTYQKLS